jgi:hypothetical protein
VSILAPLTIPVEKYVVVKVVNELALTDLLHLPAKTRVYTTFEGKSNCSVKFTDRIQNGFPPASWPAACGAFTEGSIYVQAGPLTNQPVCPACQATVKPKLRKQRQHQGGWQLTTELGTDGLWHVRRGEHATTLCSLTIAVRMGRKWPPTCVACIETGRALGLTVPPFWGWNDEREAA